MARTEKEKKNPLRAVSDLISLKPRQWWQSKAGVPMEVPPRDSSPESKLLWTQGEGTEH